MIYFDYAANTPVDEAVLERFLDTTRNYLGNPNSVHQAGSAAALKMTEITAAIAKLLGVKQEEIIYTSGASESNNFAIKGIASAKKHIGKHIITSFLEHSSVGGTLMYLQEQGYEVEMVRLTAEGQVDIEHLRELMRKDTILVTACVIDSELGVVQQIAEMEQVIKGYPYCAFHIDATQAIGKIPYSFAYGDTISIAPHKFFGLNGCGLVIKREELILPPLIHGGISTTIFRSGTPALAFADSILAALEIYLQNIEERFSYVSELQQELLLFFEQFDNVRVNNPSDSIPYIINVSVAGIRAFEFQQLLDKRGVCISTKAACSSPKSPSKPVFAVTKDKKNARESWRLSLSHKTTREEIAVFKRIFTEIITGVVE